MTGEIRTSPFELETLLKYLATVFIDSSLCQRCLSDFEVIYYNVWTPIPNSILPTDVDGVVTRQSNAVGTCTDPPWARQVQAREKVFTSEKITEDINQLD
jgi:hypothetical protein